MRTSAKRSLLHQSKGSSNLITQHKLLPGVARIRRMTRLTANGRRVLCVRPVSHDDPPKSLHCSLDFFFECKDEDDASIRRYNFGRDGRISLDLKQYSAIKHVIGIVNFGYEEDGNHHTLNPRLQVSKLMWPSCNHLR